MMAFGNVGFIGYPIVSALFGQQAVFYASVPQFSQHLFVFVLGSALVSGGQRIHFNPRILYSPAMIASYLSISSCLWAGVMCRRLSVSRCTLLGGITVPAALLIVGSQDGSDAVAQDGRQSPYLPHGGLASAGASVAAFALFTLEGWTARW